MTDQIPHNMTNVMVSLKKNGTKLVLSFTPYSIESKHHVFQHHMKQRRKSKKGKIKSNSREKRGSVTMSICNNV